MDVDVALLEQRRIDAERHRAILDDAQRGLRALFHDVAELAGEDQLAVAGQARRLDEEDIAADRRPCEPGRDTRHAHPHRHLVLELRRAEDGGEITGSDPDRPALAFGDAHRRMAQHLADLALQIPHARLAGVLGDDGAQSRIGDLGLARLQAVGLHLPAQQIAARNLELLVRRVAGEADHLHAVA